MVRAKGGDNACLYEDKNTPTKLAGEPPPTPLLSERAVDKVGEGLLKWMIEVDKVG